MRLLFFCVMMISFFIKYIQRVVCLFMCVVMLRLSSYWTFFISVSLI